jgi:hypothetical protein
MTCLRIGELFPLHASLIVQTLHLLVLPPQLRPQVFLHDFSIQEPRASKEEQGGAQIRTSQACYRARAAAPAIDMSMLEKVRSKCLR